MEHDPASSRDRLQNGTPFKPPSDAAIAHNDAVKNSQGN